MQLSTLRFLKLWCANTQHGIGCRERLNGCVKYWKGLASVIRKTENYRSNYYSSFLLVTHQRSFFTNHRHHEVDTFGGKNHDTQMLMYPPFMGKISLSLDGYSVLTTIHER